MQTKTNYSISPETRCYLDALNVFQEFKNALISALMRHYGETFAVDEMSRHSELFDTVEGVIWDYMKTQITEQMGANKQDVTI